MRKNRSDGFKAGEALVRVEFMGFLRRAAGVHRTRVKIRDNASVGGLCRQLAAELGEGLKRALLDPESGDPRAASLILVNGREISVLKGLETSVKAGDTVTFIPVSHGG